MDAKQSASGKNQDSDLKNAAGKIMDDVSQVQKTAKEKVEGLTAEVGERLETELEALQERLDRLSVYAKERLSDLDKKVHSQPYWYIVAAAAAGVALGAIARRPQA